jgi:hypothetical protein
MTPSLVPNLCLRSALAVALLLTACTGSTVPRPGPQTEEDDAAAGGSGPANGTGGTAGTPKADAAPDPVTPDAAVVKADTAPPADTRAGDAASAPTGDAKPSPNPPAGPAGPWARSLKIGLVEVTQGVFIKLGAGDSVVEPGMRNAPLIEGRPLYVRVHVAPEMGFTARMLRAVLSIEREGGKFEIEDKKMISGASTVDKQDSTFNFLVPAANVLPGSSLAAFVYEAGTAMGPDPAAPPRFPATGGADLAIKAGKMEMTVVAVPVGMLMDTPARRAKLEADIYDLYPVQKVNLRIHEPATLDGAFSSTKGFAILRMLRETENAKPNEYYHLIVNTANAGFAGTASRAGAGMNDGSRRVAITIVRNSAIDGNTNTTAHELGHNHGRPHSPGCGADGADAMYPYPTPPGFPGVDGFSLTNMAWKSKMMWRDLLSYCRPRWISDFNWIKFEERVRIVTGFAGSTTAMTQMMANRSLQGFAGPGERPDWGIVAGRLVDESAIMSDTRYAVLDLADGRQVRAPVAVEELGEGDPTRAFSVNLTGAGFTDLEVLSAKVVIDGQTSFVPVSTMYRRR